jgi:hypothetical protein
MNASKNWRGQLEYWHELLREPGLTVLVIVEATLIFLVIPLSGMGVLPGLVLPAMFLILLFAIMAVTWHSRVATIAVLIAVILSPVGTFFWREDPTPLTEWLNSGGQPRDCGRGVRLRPGDLPPRAGRGRALSEFRADVFHHLPAA